MLGRKSRTGTRQSNGELRFKIMYAVGLSCPSATLASQPGGFEPRVWQAAKGLGGFVPHTNRSGPSEVSRRFLNGTHKQPQHNSITYCFADVFTLTSSSFSSD